METVEVGVGLRINQLVCHVFRQIVTRIHDIDGIVLCLRSETVSSSRVADILNRILTPELGCEPACVLSPGYCQLRYGDPTDAFRLMAANSKRHPTRAQSIVVLAETDPHHASIGSIAVET
jgi:hypothetical protein